jgi:uncharacterized protein (DUF362 family)
MSFILDPPALFLLGVMMYYIIARLRWGLRIGSMLMGIICFILFMGGSTLLYMDVIDWPLPPTEGPVWMFHTNFTGITKADVPVALAIIMLLLYPLWHLLGYLAARGFDEGFFLRTVSYDDVKSRRDRPETKLVVRRGTAPRQLVRDGIEAIGGMGTFVKAGNKVVIKPNISGGNPGIPGSFTSIDVVDEIVKMVRDQGAEPIVVDSDMIWTRFEPVAEAQGWKTWAKDNGVPLKNLAGTRSVRFDFGEDSSTRRVPVSKLMVDADVIISVPTMKTHLLTNITIAMKNMYGTFPQENKAKYHRKGIENVVYDVNRAFTPHLTVIDGTIGGEAFGPLSCKPLNFQTIIASNDVVAADAVACRLMGYDPLDVVHVRIAHENGLGDAGFPFSLEELPYEHLKDGKWERPEPLVTTFYEAVCELVLLVPGMQLFFDLAADLVLYGFATLPIFKDLTPAALAVMNDVFGALFRTGYCVSKSLLR